MRQKGKNSTLPFVKIIWHPWDPWGCVHIDLNKNSVQTGCVNPYLPPRFMTFWRRDIKICHGTSSFQPWMRRYSAPSLQPKKAIDMSSQATGYSSVGTLSCVLHWNVILAKEVKIVKSDWKWKWQSYELGISWPFPVIFSPTTLITSTKLRNWRSFWCTQSIKILIGSKAMT